MTIMLAFWPIHSFWHSSGPAAWIALWSVLALLTIALVVLLRTKWRHAKPWQKCAVWSP